MKKVLILKSFLLVFVFLVSSSIRIVSAIPGIEVDIHAIANYSGKQNIGKADAEDIVWDGNGPEGVGVYVYNFDLQTTTTLSNNGSEYDTTMSNGLVAWRSTNSTNDGIQMFICPKTGKEEEEPDEIYESEDDRKLCESLKVVSSENLDRVYFTEKNYSQGTTITLLKVWDSITDTTLTISDGSSEKVGITLFNNYVFWSDNRSGNYDIWAYDCNSNLTFALVSAPGDQLLSTCKSNGNNTGSYFITWKDGRNTSEQNPKNYDIYGKNLLTGQVFIVANTTKNEQDPVAIGNTIAWIEKDIIVDQNGIQTGWQDSIIMKDLSNGIPITVSNSATYKNNLRINEDFVIWCETPQLYLNNFSWDLSGFSIDLTIPFSISDFASDQFSASLYGNKVFWEDNRNDAGDLYYATLLVQQ